MTYTYLELNNKELAEMYARKLPSIGYVQNFILINILEGTEKLKYNQNFIQTLTNYLIITIRTLTKNDDYSTEKKILILEKINS